MPLIQREKLPLSMEISINGHLIIKENNE